MVHANIISKQLLMIPSCSSLCLSGEWQTRFDPLVTSKGVFYLDNQNSVSVDMMKSAQYPIRLLDDPELEAQVTPAFMSTSVMLLIPSIITSGAKNALFNTPMCDTIWVSQHRVCALENSHVRPGSLHFSLL